jgi:potassium/hydrogen antiporter
MLTNYVILTLCVIVILSYIFDISFKYSKIPGVVLLIAMGIVLQVAVEYSGLKIPNMRPVLPILGTLGLILIVMDASLEIKLEKKKARELGKGIFAAVVLLILFTSLLTILVVNVLDQPFITTLLNTIPLGIISSAVAISSSSLLNREQREFITFESAVSDIFGILAFDFIILNQEAFGMGLVNFAFKGLLTIAIAVVMTAILALMLHRIKYHVSYIIILTSVVMIYVIAKMVHLPGLFLVVVFGLSLSNNQLVEHTYVNKYIDFIKFREDINSFKKILSELTFIVRSFFFIMFGFYSNLAGLFNLKSLLLAAGITAGIFILRWIYFTVFIGRGSGKMVWFAPRGLITILLFLSIPSSFRMDLINEEVVTLVILLSIFVMMIGNFIPAKRESAEDCVADSP